MLERSSDATRARARRRSGCSAAGSIPTRSAGPCAGCGAEVVHAHNVHPTLGWRALAAAQAAGARTLLHLHNFRLFCAIGIAYRDGAPCFRCRGTQHVPRRAPALPRVAARGGRVRGGAAPPAAPAVRARRSVRGGQRVDRGASARLGTAGLVNRHVAQLHAQTTGFAAESRAGAGEFALAAGRLTEEKGFDTAIAAARAAGVPLVIAGDGTGRGAPAGPGGRRRRPLHRPPRRRARSPSCATRAAVVLAPSRWEEPCPYSVLEALAAGRAGAGLRPRRTAGARGGGRDAAGRRIGRRGRTRSRSCGRAPACGPSGAPQRSRERASGSARIASTTG